MAVLDEVHRHEYGKELEETDCNTLNLAPNPLQGLIEPTHCTDAGNAIRFARQFYEDAVYVPEAGNWFVWNGQTWQEDQGSVFMLRFAKETARRIFAEAHKADDGTAETKPIRDGLLNWAMLSESQARLEAMIKSAKTTCRTMHYQDFDADAMLFNAANCTIDLRTGKPVEDPSQFKLKSYHRRKDFITKISPVKYDPEASVGGSRWERFLLEIMDGDSEKVAFLQRMIGYALTGLCDEECFFVLWGSGRNGKSKFVEAISYVLGDYYKVASFDTFVAKRHEEKLNDIAGFRGARFISASESEHSKRLAEAKIKRMTGRDPVVGEFKYQEQFSYVPQYKIVLVSNYKPKVVGTDDGIWERMHLVPFTRFFRPEERDAKLPDKLRAEASVILKWAIEGCLMWQWQGLNPPESIRQATKEYRQEQNVLGHFIEDRCVQGDNSWVSKGILYDAYKPWAERMGEFIMPMAEFNERIGMMFDDGRSGSRGRHWKGVALRSEFALSDDEQDKVGEAIQ